MSYALYTAVYNSLWPVVLMSYNGDGLMNRRGEKVLRMEEGEGV